MGGMNLKWGGGLKASAHYAKMAFIFQIYYATPVIRLLIRVISDLKVTCNYLSDLNE